MSNDALMVLQCLFQTIWQLFTSWNFPGTNVTPATMFLFLISSAIGLRYVLMFFHSPNASATGISREVNKASSSNSSNK